MVSYGEKEPSPDWLADRIRSACTLRASLGIDSDAVRLVNAEGDFVPGIIADRYGDTIVVSLHTRAMELRAAGIVAALSEGFPGTRVFLKRDEHHARVEALQLPMGYLAGDGDGTSVIVESGVRFTIDFARGQKTGFYLDQRANRTLAAGLAAGKTVLNLFSYTGAFALRAAAAGASHVVSVDSSARAVEACRMNAEMNPSLRADAFTWVQADAFSFLKEPGRHDVVIVDPPPLRPPARRGRGRAAGLCRAVPPGAQGRRPRQALRFLFSCSGAVDRPLFRQIVAEAALRSGRSVRLVRELQADADHPVAAVHPEGEYLKGWLVHAQ